MGNRYWTLTAALTPDALMRWTERMDSVTLPQEARAMVSTESMRDWLMSDIAAHRTRLNLKSLAWLATDAEAPSLTTEHLDSRGYWWFAWVLYRADVQAAIADLNEMLRYAHDHPDRFGATTEEVLAAHAWDEQCDELDFDMPDASGDGDDPTYVLCSILALRRLLNIAQAQGLPVVHMRFSFRRSV